MSKVIKSFRVIEKNNEITPLEHYSDDLLEKDYEKAYMEKYIELGKLEYEKIINKANEKALNIINEAEDKRESLINDAYNRAKEVLEESKHYGFDEGYKNGFDEGFNKGYKEGKLISDNLIRESLEIKNGYIEKKATLLEELEKDIIQLVIDIYEKVINKKNEEDSELIISLVLNGINNLDSTDKLTITTSKEDYDILEMNKDEILAKASMISELILKYDMSFEKGDCIIETSKGNIDASLKNQVEEVKELITTILNNEWYYGKNN